MLTVSFIVYVHWAKEPTKNVFCPFCVYALNIVFPDCYFVDVGCTKMVSAGCSQGEVGWRMWQAFIEQQAG